MLSIFRYALVFLEYSSSSFSQNYFWNFDEVVTITDVQTDSRVMILNSQFHIYDFFFLLHFFSFLWLQAYLFISSQRVAGCLVAEPIQKAYKILSSSPDERSDDTSSKEAGPNSNKLQFGTVNFQREVVQRAPSVNSREALDGTPNGPIVCEKEAVPAICGIRAIWVTPSNRRKHIASQLLDAVRWVHELLFLSSSPLGIGHLISPQETNKLCEVKKKKTTWNWMKGFVWYPKWPI